MIIIKNKLHLIAQLLHKCAGIDGEHFVVHLDGHEPPGLRHERLEAGYCLEFFKQKFSISFQFGVGVREELLVRLLQNAGQCRLDQCAWALDQMHQSSNAVAHLTSVFRFVFKKKKD
jgi:hypothetical protein